MRAIYKKEMRSYFHSLSAYLFLALFLAISGVYFSVICMSYGYTDYAANIYPNITIILSSHILSEVNAICDYVLIIDQGKLVAEDTPEHLAEHFADKNRILLSVKGEREQIEEALEASGYIASYEVTGEYDGVLEVTAETEGT